MIVITPRELRQLANINFGQKQGTLWPKEQLLAAADEIEQKTKIIEYLWGYYYGEGPVDWDHLRNETTKNTTPICAVKGCTNKATHTWSGHPTCDECETPMRRQQRLETEKNHDF